MGVRISWMREAAATVAKREPYLLSLSRIRKRGRSPQGVASRSCWATQASVGWAVVAALRAIWTIRREDSSIMTKTEERLEEEVVDLYKVTGPDLGSVISEEDRPGLRRR